MFSPQQLRVQEVGMCLLGTSLLLVVVGFGFVSSYLGIWQREPYSTVATKHRNVSIVNTLPPISPGEDVALPAFFEEELATLSFLNHYNHTRSAAIRSSIRANAGGYRNDSNGELSLWTSDNGTLTRAIHVDSKQRVGVGTQTPQAALHVVGEVLSTVGFNLVSDRDAKVDQGLIDRNRSLEMVRQVAPHRYWRKGSAVNESVQYGFYAQDFLDFPEGKDIVRRGQNAKFQVVEDVINEDGLRGDLSVDVYSILAHVWNAVAAVDEQNQARIRELEKENEMHRAQLMMFVELVGALKTQDKVLNSRIESLLQCIPEVKRGNYAINCYEQKKSMIDEYGNVREPPKPPSFFEWLFGKK